MTRFHKLSIALTAASFLLLVGIVLGRVPALAAKTRQAPVLRGSAIEIVDARGQVRFSVGIEAPSVEGGKRFPDRVLMRFGSPGAGPGVKLVSSAEGTALLLMHNDRPAARIETRADSAFIRIIGADGKERSIAP
jgi:hypothetical protein